MSESRNMSENPPSETVANAKPVVLLPWVQELWTALTCKSPALVAIDDNLRETLDNVSCFNLARALNGNHYVTRFEARVGGLSAPVAAELGKAIQKSSIKDVVLDFHSDSNYLPQSRVIFQELVGARLDTLVLRNFDFMIIQPVCSALFASARVLELCTTDVASPEEGKVLAQVIRENKTVTKLVLDNLGDDAFKACLGGLAMNETCEELVVERNDYMRESEDTGIDKSARAMLASNRKLTALKWCHNSYDWPLEDLLHGLVGCRLSKVDLSQSPMYLKEARVLRTALQQNEFIQELILDDCLLCEDCVGVITEGLLNNKHVMVLSLASNPFCRHPRANDALRRLLKENDMIETLNMSGSPSCAASDSDLFRTELDFKTNLTTLILDDMGWNDEDAEHFGLAFAQHSPRLCCLSLAGNFIGGAGLSRLFCVLRDAGIYSNIKEVNLKGSAGATIHGELAEGMGSNMFESLDLSHTYLSDEMLIAYCNSIRNRPSVSDDDEGISPLKCLKLNHNSIQGRGLEKLADIFPSLPLLEHLEVELNRCDPLAAWNFVHALQHNTSLTTIELRCPKLVVGDQEMYPDQIAKYVCDRNRFNKLVAGEAPAALFPHVLSRMTASRSHMMGLHHALRKKLPWLVDNQVQPRPDRKRPAENISVPNEDETNGPGEPSFASA